ncbi:MAG: hypothetical protein QM496_11895 [Verrucomicrobiota bacterium]
MRCIIFLTIVLTITLISTSAETVRERLASDPKFPIYTVVFGITVVTKGKFDSFSISKIVDPKSGTTDSVKIPISKQFVAATRKKLIEMKVYEPRLKDGKPVEFYTYVYYSPDYPKVVIMDLDVSIEDQP